MCDSERGGWPPKQHCCVFEQVPSPLSGQAGWAPLRSRPRMLLDGRSREQAAGAPAALHCDASSRWRSPLGAGRGALPSRRGPERGVEGSAAQVPAGSCCRFGALLDGAARAEPRRSLPRSAGSPVQLAARGQRARPLTRSPRLGGAFCRAPPGERPFLESRTRRGRRG